MKNIKKIVNSDAAYEILDNSNCAGSTWTSGGCAILASALNKVKGYPIYVIFNRNFKSPEHFGVMTPTGSIIDADGEHSSADEWLQFFKENEFPRVGELIVYPYASGMKMGEIKFDQRASDELAELIKSYNKKGFISERYEEKSFLDWLSGKFGKKIEKRLGGGMLGEVYEFGPAVIKLSSRNMFDNASVANKNIPGIAKVYAHGKIIVPIQFLERSIRDWYSLDTKDTTMTIKNDRVLYYLILEKLDSGRKVRDEVDDVRWAIENFSKEFKISGDHDLRDLFVNRSNEQYIQNLYKYIQDNFSKSDAIIVSETMVELVSIFRSVGKFYNWFDVHPGQFGRNSKGELVAFDLDNPTESHANFDKHLVSENTEIIRRIVRKVLREEIEVVGINDKTKLSVFDNESVYGAQASPISDFENYIDLVFNSINEDEEPSPTFEWDIAKEKIDKSTSFIKTKEQAQEYFDRVLEKIQSIPKSIKIRIAKYVAYSLIGILGYSTIKTIINDKVPELSNSIVNKKEIAPRASSDKLKQMLKQEEGSAQEKGEPVLSAYKLGDGMITVGWGHAERIDDSQFAPGQKITIEKAEQLFASDVANAENGLNKILDDWKRDGIKVKITQPMYDAMASMIFNMGIGNFRKSDFIQLVKQGRYGEAAERILTTNVTYPGHVIRRQRESDLFSRGIQNNMIAQLREDSIHEVAMRLKDLPDSTALFIREINQGYDLVLYDPKTKEVYGTITVAQRDYYGPNYFVTGVAAEKGFGPFIYELAMMHLSKLGRGLMPARDGDVRDVAFNVWKQFFNRADIKKETMNIDSPYYRFDILGFAKDDFDSDEEIEEMLSELKDHQIEALKIFNTIYSTDIDNQYVELANKADVYSKNGFDIQVAIDKADEFWNDSYMS